MQKFAYSLFSLERSWEQVWQEIILGYCPSEELADYREALKWFHRTLPFYEDLDLLRKQSMVNLNIGVIHYKIADYEASFTHLKKSHS